MVYQYYEALFVISFILSVIYVFIWQKHYDINITAIFILVPIANFAYILYGRADTEFLVRFSTKMVYMGGCFLTYFITICVFNICEIQIGRRFRVTLFLITSLIYMAVLSIGKLPVFYKDLQVRTSDGVVYVSKVYGPVHPLFYIMIAVYFLMGIVAIVYSIRKKNQVSDKVLYLLAIPEVLAIVAFFGNTMLGKKIEIMPIFYVFAQIVYIFIVRRMSLYNVDETVIDSIVQNGETGFLSIDFKNRFLGANQSAQQMIPELKNLQVDDEIDKHPEFDDNINHWVYHFKKDGAKKNIYIKKVNPEISDTIFDADAGDKAYSVDINYLYDNGMTCGYQILLNDDTQNQKYISLLDKYNEELEEDVQAKTRHIIEMHDNLILSMATMVESRDNSTGGHIKRTSEGVRILIDAIKKDTEFCKEYGINDEFCKDIIKAAPMHDLGKVAVDDAILRKPGRFTPEEFEIMKTHAPEGARIVHEILKDTDDESFKIIAENVAHYHHERMDGSGYPEGLKGDEIPLEARIMAIADVYDALVSKRVYKESMSFEQADKIMMESMGKHFDKRLERFYLEAKPKLEEYYSSLQ